MLDIADIAYAAGLVDGEGCIGIYRNGSSYHFLLIKVAMCEPHAINFLVDKFGARHNPFTNKFGVVYRAVFTGQRAYVFLKHIQPYLRVKKDQADLAIEFCEVRKDFSGFRLDQAEFDLRADYEHRIKALKKRNVGVSYG